jgi:uncharacterized protein
MRIDNSFTVGAPAERAWAVLTDLEGIAPCLPGARLTGVDGDVHSGKVRIKVGPVTAEYAGTARFTEKDDAAHRAVISARGRDSRGAGNASATITARLEPDGDRTRVVVETDLTITGKVAQFGRGMIKEISEKLLGQFADCLEGRFAEPAPTAATPAPTAEAPTTKAPTAEAPAAEAPAAEPAQEPGPAERAEERPASPDTVPEREAAPLDLLSLAGSSVTKRLVPLAIGVVVVVAVIVYFVVR